MKIFIIVLTLCSSALAYDYDPNDFATEVVSYTTGIGIPEDYFFQIWDGNSVPFDDPTTALGRPTIDTTGDKTPTGKGFIDYSETVPVVNVYPACRAYEMVSLGLFGGQIILSFDHPVADDKNNPFGIDLIVFGNTRKFSGNWYNRNPDTFFTDSGYGEEIGIVSVSQDGENWYTYNAGPFADSFAPTLGRIYDPNTPDTSIGSWNSWWGEPTDPTLPLDPNIIGSDFDSLTVAEGAILYGQSAGGTGFDLSQSGMAWIKYIKIESNDEATTEIDAISDVIACGDYKHPFPSGDITEDCIVDFRDFAELAHVWEGSEQNFIDLNDLSDNWLKCTWQCEN